MNRLTFGERAEIALKFVPAMLLVLLVAIDRAGKPVNWRAP